MRSLVRRHHLGEPLQILVLVSSLALSGYAALSLIDDRAIATGVWFVGAALVHDVVLLPLYVLLDRVALRRRADVAPKSWINHIRFPAAISLLLLVVFLPSIARASGKYNALTGLSADPYFLRWLAVTGVLFAVSAALYAVTLLRRS
ncbi:hypothetical protein [Jatrophihabitans fulvus]